MQAHPALTPAGKAGTRFRPTCSEGMEGWVYNKQRQQTRVFHTVSTVYAIVVVL